MVKSLLLVDVFDVFKDYGLIWSISTVAVSLSVWTLMLFLVVIVIMGGCSMLSPKVWWTMIVHNGVNYEKEFPYCISYVCILC